MSGCCGYVTGLWHCIWSWSRLRWVCQPTSASPLGSSPYLLQPSQHRGTVSATHESAQMRTQEDARFKNVFLSYMLHADTQLRSCVHPGVPPQSNGIRMELPGQVKYKLFPPLPPSPLSKDTDGICLIRDTISFWHCSKPEPSKCGVGARMNNMWHVISLTKASDSF